MHIKSTRFFLVFTIILTCSCATTVKIKRIVPAKYDISGVTSIAVMSPFSYETTYHHKGSNPIPDAIEAALEKNGFFEVQEIKGIYGLNMDERHDKSTIINAGKRAGVDTVISGKVMAYQVTLDRKEIPVEKDEETWISEPYIDAAGNKKYRTRPVKTKRTFYETALTKAAEVSFWADMVDVGTGKVLGHEYFTRIGEEKAQGDTEIRNMTSGDKMLLGVTKTLANDFVLAMTPHEITEKIAFKKDKECKPGVKRAKKGEWSEAVFQWQQVLSGNSSSECALYNLGLAEESVGNNEKALEFYKKALYMDPQEKLYLRAISRIQSKIKDQKKLKEQMQGR